MALAREEAGGRIEADPSRPGQVDLDPRVQIGEVLLGSGRPGERLDVRHELDEIAGDEARRQAEVAQELHEEPGRVAARPAAEGERLLLRLHAGLVADHVGDVALDALVQLDQEVERGARLPADGPEIAGEARGERLHAQVGEELARLLVAVHEGEPLGVGLEEEVEGVVDGELGDQVHLDAQLPRLVREDDARQVVALRVLLPVDEVMLGRDPQRVGQDRRAAVRGGPEAHDLGREPDPPVVSIGADVVEGDVNGHDALPRAQYLSLFDASSAATL